MVAGGPGEFEMENLLRGQYVVCAEVRLGNTSLQSHCAQAMVDSPLDTSSTTSTIANNTMGLPIIVAIAVAGLALLAVASYTVYSLVGRNRRLARER